MNGSNSQRSDSYLQPINGKTFAIERTGTGDPLVMIHGLGGSTNTWFSQVAPLARSFDVIRFDLEGSGRSPLAGGAPLSIDGFVEDVVALIDGLGIERAHFAGHSMGTIIAQKLAATRPERVRSLALFGPVTELAEPGREAMRARAKVARERGMPAVAETLLPVALSAETRGARLGVVTFVRESLLAQNPEGYAQTCEALASGTRADLARIACPVLLMTGDEDGVGPASSLARMSDQLSDATVRIVSGCGHWTTVEKPAEVNAALLEFYYGRRKSATAVSAKGE